MPQNVKSISTKGKYDVVMHLNGSYNPGFFLNNNLPDTNNVLPAAEHGVEHRRGGRAAPRPRRTIRRIAKKIYDYLNKAGGDGLDVRDQPAVEGRRRAVQAEVVQRDEQLLHARPQPQLRRLAEADHVAGSGGDLHRLHLRARRGPLGSLDVAVGIDPSQLAEAPALKSQGIDIYGGPGWGWFGGIINFKDKTNDFNNVIAQLYVRQAIDYLINQPAIIKGVYKGAAVPAYGQTPTAPLSPYAPASRDQAAVPVTTRPRRSSMLKAHGWKVVPGGPTTCVKPGRGRASAAPASPQGTPIAFVWANQPEAVSTTGALEAEVFSSEAKQAAGIDITLQTKTFNFLTSNYNDQNPAAAKYTNDWGVNNYGGLFTDYYPTAEGVWNTGGGFNPGDYNDPTATSLMNDSVHSGNPNAIKVEAPYVQTHPPVLFMPDCDYLLAVNVNKVAGPPDGWTAMTQQQWFPQYWYVK